MNAGEIRKLAQELVEGQITVDAMVQHLTRPGTADLDEAQIDLNRASRCGFPEVIYAEGKPLASLEKIFRTLLEHDGNVLATRVTKEQAAMLVEKFPAACYNETARTVRIPEGAPTRTAPCQTAGSVAVVAAGTSDLPVAEEARETAEWTGAQVCKVYDVGVAGPHRLQQRLPEIRGADAIVVVAGMEGALPSVVGGHVPCPVIAVPTSVGYGASFGGIAALLGMLNSCTANVTVVNIDAGFKAGYVAGLIAHRTANGGHQPERSND
jgi:NCAIR mutase (PurE)-related protein